MTSRRLLFRATEHVLAVAAALVLLSFGWRRLSARPDIITLSAAQIGAMQKRLERPLVFPGSYADTLVLFLDYRCPYCAVHYGDIVRHDAPYGVVVRHVVASVNSLEAQAAVAAECARGEGRFHAFSYALFARRDSIGYLSWRSFGAVAGVENSDRLSECIESRAPIGTIREDMELAHQLGVLGTPAVAYRGRMYLGSTGIRGLFLAVSSGRQ
jgi:protein-disulfide isomerase